MAGLLFFVDNKVYDDAADIKNAKLILSYYKWK